MDKPLVSIIIPSFNRGNLIAQTLDSIVKQSYTNWECIIVDDHSNDNTLEVAKEYCDSDKRFQLFSRPSSMPKGANACRNFGFEKSIGEYINWFDSDDIMLENKLHLQVEELFNSNSNMVVCQTLVFENSIENILGLRNENIYSTDFFNDFITNDIKWLTQAPMIKRKFILDNNLKFDESIHQSQERDFFVRVLSKIDDFLVIEKPLVLFRKHENSISHAPEYSSVKLRSNFLVNKRIFDDYNSELTKKSRNYLLQILINCLKKSILNKDNILSKEIFASLKEKAISLSTFDKIKLRLGVFMLKNFGKGELFFKIKK